MELDDAYANAAHITGADAYPARWAAQAVAFRETESETGHARLDHPYGPGEREALDLFLPKGRPAGLCVFVHGGYWLRFDRSYWSHLARGPLARGWAVAMPSYDLCPDVTIAEITRQIACAVTSAAAEIDGPIALTGHSPGAIWWRAWRWRVCSIMMWRDASVASCRYRPSPICARFSRPR